MIEKIYICGITATRPTKTFTKLLWVQQNLVDWEYQRKLLDVVKYLKAEKILVYAIEQAEGALSLENFKITSNEKYAFVLGNEVKGVSQAVINLCDGVIEIPQEGTKHSLNISVASGVVLWEFYQKFKTL